MLVKVILVCLIFSTVMGGAPKDIILSPGGEYFASTSTICLDLEYRSQTPFNAQVWMGETMIQDCQSVRVCPMTHSTWMREEYYIRFSSNSTKPAALSRHGANYLCTQELVYPLVIMVIAVLVVLAVVAGGLLVERYCYRPRYRYEYGVFVPV